MMPVDEGSPAGFSLRRWSRRKLAAAREAPSTTEPPQATVPSAGTARPVAAGSGEPLAANAAPSPQGIPETVPSGTPAEPLAPVESLSFESDFRPYLQPKVDESLRRQALRRLFEDPHFNVMDGLDIYVGDYSQPDPIPPEMLRQIVHARALLEPVTTRINAKGEVEMVVPDAVEPPRGAEDAADGGEAAPAAAAAEPAAATALPAPDATAPLPAATADRGDEIVAVARRDDNSPRR